MPKKQTYSEIKKALPNINSERVEVIADQLDEILSIKSLFQSDGGKILENKLKENCSLALRKAIIVSKKGDAQDTVYFILDYSANIDLLSKLKDISIEL